MASVVQCFLLERTDLVRQVLRRYRSRQGSPACTTPGGHGYHNAEAHIGDQPQHLCPGWTKKDGAVHGDVYPHGDPDWPKRCGCGYIFQPDDEWQYNPFRLFRRADRPEDVSAFTTLRDSPPGAIWRATWMEDRKDFCGSDGRSYMVRLPNGRDWMIDARANNCTLPNDRMHKCWCRHGDAPKFTVDKDGHTCAAGAGSIQAGDYHGFLVDGQLREC